jgi:5-methyltetrahydrofolate corrinoid/iron sulfur protein methyltransferase
MIMLEKLGMKSCIVDAFDRDLYEIGRGKQPDIAALVHRVLDGGEPDMENLTKEARAYVKTARVLLGHSLYSDSWLDL